MSIYCSAFRTDSAKLRRPIPPGLLPESLRVLNTRELYMCTWISDCELKVAFTYATMELARSSFRWFTPRSNKKWPDAVLAKDALDRSTQKWSTTEHTA